MYSVGLFLQALVAVSPTVREVDSVTSREVARLGLAAGLAPMLADDALVLIAGEPILVGRTAVRAAFDRRADLAAWELHWEPDQIWTSRAGDFAVVYGTSWRRRRGSGDSPRPGALIVVWRRTGRWEVNAMMLGSVGGDMPVVGAAERVVSGGVGAPFDRWLEADRAFAAAAARGGAEAAFGQFAAPDAMILASGGPLRGPEAIAAAHHEEPPSAWWWSPVAAGGSSSGDLGFTVGQSVITPRTGAPSYGKYLTVWTRMLDGSVRFLTDGGNARPPEPGR